MNNALLEKIASKLSHPELVHDLAHKLSGTELNSLLLEVMARQTAALTPAQLLSNYQKNRFVKPADLPVVRLREMELDLLRLFAQNEYQPVELSPVAALGSCSVFGCASQHKILSALRGTEVLADATNALALHVADTRKSKSREALSENVMRFSCIQRHVRAQQIAAKGFTPHFKIACLVTAGHDNGSYSFEKLSLLEHVRLMTTLFTEYYLVDKISFRFLCRSGYPDSIGLAVQVKQFIKQQLPDTIIDIVEAPEKENNYYCGIQHKIDITVNNRAFEIGDGGFVDWTQKLLQNKKERMLSTGIGFEFMYRILSGEL